MRMAFGLVGILVTIGVIVWVMHMAYLPYVKTVVQTQQQVTPKIQEFKRPRHHQRRRQSIPPINSNPSNPAEKSRASSSPISIPLSAMVTVYDLKRDDSIVAINPGHGDMERVKDINDAESAEDRLMEALPRRRTNHRHARRKRNDIEPLKHSPPAVRCRQRRIPPAPKSNAGSGKDSLQQQLDAIQQIPTRKLI